MTKSTASNRRLHGSTTDVAIKDSWRTPPELFYGLDKIFNFSLDAAASDEHHLCSTYFTEENDALSQDWGAVLDANNCPTRNVWCNPPFSNMGGFISSTIEQSRDGITTVLIANWDHSASWCSRAIEKASEVWLVTGFYDDDMEWRSGRIRFVHPDTGIPAKDQPKAQALFIFRGTTLNTTAQIVPVPLNKIWDAASPYFPQWDENGQRIDPAIANAAEIKAAKEIDEAKAKRVAEKAAELAAKEERKRQRDEDKAKRDAEKAERQRLREEAKVKRDAEKAAKEERKRQRAEAKAKRDAEKAEG